MSEVRVNNLSNESLSGGPYDIRYHHFFYYISLCHHREILQSRPQDCPPGSLRFNTDSAKLEYYRGDTIGWVEIEAELTDDH